MTSEDYLDSCIDVKMARVIARVLVEAGQLRSGLQDAFAEEMETSKLTQVVWAGLYNFQSRRGL